MFLKIAITLAVLIAALLIFAATKPNSDEDWLKPVDTPFFGTVTRIRMFVHILFHNSHHAG